MSRLSASWLFLLIVALVFLATACQSGGKPQVGGHHSHGIITAEPGFMPVSGTAARFVRQSGTTPITVFPTLIRSSQGNQLSVSSQDQILAFLKQNQIGIAASSDHQFSLDTVTQQSQWQMFQDSLQAIGNRIARSGATSYSLVMEMILPPVMGELKSVFGIHVFILNPDGSNAFSFLLNSHHELFVKAELSTVDLSASGLEELINKSTKVAMTALNTRLDRAVTCMNTTTATTKRYAPGVLDDYQGVLVSAKDKNGISLGYFTFNGPKSTAKVSTTRDHPTLTQESTGNRVLQLKLDAPDWGGVVKFFENESQDQWITHDWKAFNGFTFWLYGNNSGVPLFVDILDNRNPCSRRDDAERYTYTFEDNFSGWKKINVPFKSMRRKEIYNEAPNDGLGLIEVHGWGFGATNMERPLTFFIDDFELNAIPEKP